MTVITINIKKENTTIAAIYCPSQHLSKNQTIPTFLITYIITPKKLSRVHKQLPNENNYPSDLRCT